MFPEMADDFVEFFLTFSTVVIIFLTIACIGTWGANKNQKELPQSVVACQVVAWIVLWLLYFFFSHYLIETYALSPKQTFAIIFMSIVTGILILTLLCLTSLNTTQSPILHEKEMEEKRLEEIKQRDWSYYERIFEKQLKDIRQNQQVNI